jgi:hypothetical protein
MLEECAVVLWAMHIHQTTEPAWMSMHVGIFLVTLMKSVPIYLPLPKIESMVELVRVRLDILQPGVIVQMLMHVLISLAVLTGSVEIGWRILER